MLGSFFKSNQILNPIKYIFISIAILTIFITCFFTPIISEQAITIYDANIIENMQISSSRLFMAYPGLYKNKFTIWEKGISYCRSFKFSQRHRYRCTRRSKIYCSSKWKNNIYRFFRWRWLHNNIIKR